MVVQIILLLLFGVILWLLVAPITINVNTWSNDYSLRWSGIGNVSLLTANHELLLRMHLWFWQKDFFPLRPSAKKEEKKKKPKKKGNSQWHKFPAHRMRKLLRAVHVRQLQLELDTGDYVTNAYLYPLAYYLNKPTRPIAVNFEGRTNLFLQLDIRLIRVVGAMLF